MVLVDAVHEDAHVVYGGAAHLLRAEAKGRAAPAPRITRDTVLTQRAAHEPEQPLGGPLDVPLDRLPADAQALWRWAASRPLAWLAQGAEMDWSPEELARMHDARLRNRATLGDLPLVVLARTPNESGNGAGTISADSLARERQAQAADLARLSRRGRLVTAPHSGQR